MGKREKRVGAISENDASSPSPLSKSLRLRVHRARGRSSWPPLQFRQDLSPGVRSATSRPNYLQRQDRHARSFPIRPRPLQAPVNIPFLINPELCRSLNLSCGFAPFRPSPILAGPLLGCKERHLATELLTKAGSARTVLPH